MGKTKHSETINKQEEDTVRVDARTHSLQSTDRAQAVCAEPRLLECSFRAANSVLGAAVGNRSPGGIWSRDGLSFQVSKVPVCESSRDWQPLM